MTNACATAQLANLDEVSKELPGCYRNNFQSFLFDFYANFSWSVEKKLTEMKELRGLKGYKAVCGKILAAYGFDMGNEIDEAIQDEHPQ